jgi:hypothetical protein
MAVAAFSQPDTSFIGAVEYLDVLIANGQSLSGAVDMGDRALVGALISAAWTAAGLSFQASPDGVTYGKMLDATGAEITAAAVAAGNYVATDPKHWVGVRFMKLVSGTNGTQVTQGADRLIRIACRRLY